MHTDRPDDRPIIDGTGSSGSPVTNMHDVLSDRRRRAICYSLQDHDAPLSTAALATRLHRLHRSVGVDDEGEPFVPPIEESKVRTEARSMAEFGILAYDPVADVVWIPDGVSLSVAPPWETYRRETTDQSPASAPQERPLQ